MNIIVIVHRSAGNQEVGSMWHESYEFPSEVTLGEMIEKIREHLGSYNEDIIIPVRKESPNAKP